MVYLRAREGTCVFETARAPTTDERGVCARLETVSGSRTRTEAGWLLGSVRELGNMIPRSTGAFGLRKCACSAALVFTIGWGWVAPCTGNAEDRAVLSAVTPDTLGIGEEVTVRWNYEDGNGGATAYIRVAFVTEHMANICMCRLVIMFLANGVALTMVASVQLCVGVGRVSL